MLGQAYRLGEGVAAEASQARAALDVACAIKPDFAACAFAKRQRAEMDAPPGEGGRRAVSAGDAVPDSDALRVLYGRVDPVPEGPRRRAAAAPACAWRWARRTRSPPRSAGCWPMPAS
ncbi:hypothetical protein ACU4GA_24925 [Methylobacterium oryzae CBMB20]